MLRLAEALEVPLRERNALLLAAGLQAEFPERTLEEGPMRELRGVLERVLQNHEPYPAWIFRRGFVFVASNRGGEALFPGLGALSPEALVELWFGPGPFRSMVENWPEVLCAGLASLRRDALHTRDESLAALLRRAELLVGDPARSDAASASALPVACPRFRIGERVVRTISTVLRFDTALEVTASELRVELMFPADAASDAFFRELAPGAGDASPPEQRARGG